MTQPRSSPFWVFWVCLGGSGGVPPGGSGAPGWQIPGTRGLLGRSGGRPCQFFSKTRQNIHFWHFWGGYPPGGSGAPGWQNPGTRGLLCRFEGRPCQFSPKTGQKHTFLAFGGVGGTPQGGLGPQAGRIQGPGASCAGPRQCSRKVAKTKRGGTVQGGLGPRLAESRDSGPPVPVRGATLPIFSENRPKTRIFGFWRCGGTSQGSGAPGWQNPGTGASCAGPTGATPPMFPKSGQNIHFWHFWRSGAPGWQNPGAGPTGGTPPMFPKSGQNKHFWQFWGSGKYPHKFWAPAWQIPGTRSLLGLSEGATPPSSQPPHLLGNLPCLLP